MNRNTYVSLVGPRVQSLWSNDRKIFIFWIAMTSFPSRVHKASFPLVASAHARCPVRDGAARGLAVEASASPFPISSTSAPHVLPARSFRCFVLGVQNIKAVSHERAGDGSTKILTCRARFTSHQRDSRRLIGQASDCRCFRGLSNFSVANNPAYPCPRLCKIVFSPFSLFS